MRRVPSPIRSVEIIKTIEFYFLLFLLKLSVQKGKEQPFENYQRSQGYTKLNNCNT